MLEKIKVSNIEIIKKNVFKFEKEFSLFNLPYILSAGRKQGLLFDRPVVDFCNFLIELP